ncbi:MAG: diguanylate cyclase [Candidatus Polarisedimenticolaceae bacterium]|nr:diguanylate cyclase [Candidatus Polarisedimenticolaceae bacterium]
MLDHDFALLLLDVQMPGMDGFEVAELMRSNITTEHIPIIFVTAINTEQQYIFKGYESGAVDYLRKPLEPIILCSKVNVFLDLWHQQNLVHQTLLELERANQRITEQAKILQEQAIRDHLTGLYQRRWLDEILAKEVSLSNRHARPLSLAIIDIDHFKKVNDTYGHLVGDAVLITLAKFLENSIRTEDIVFRFGGEEFVILMPNSDLESAEKVCHRICRNVANYTIKYHETDYHITISIGVAELLMLQSKTAHSLTEQADNALYQAKDNGRNRVLCHLGNL